MPLQLCKRWLCNRSPPQGCAPRTGRYTCITILAAINMLTQTSTDGKNKHMSACCSHAIEFFFSSRNGNLCILPFQYFWYRTNHTRRHSGSMAKAKYQPSGAGLADQSEDKNHRQKEWQASHRALQEHGPHPRYQASFSPCIPRSIDYLLMVPCGDAHRLQACAVGLRPRPLVAHIQASSLPWSCQSTGSWWQF